MVNYTDNDSVSDIEDCDHSAVKRSKKMTKQEGCHCALKSVPQDEILQKQMEDVKETLKVLVDNIPKKVDEAPAPEQPTLTDHLGKLFDQKIKNAISDIHQSIAKAPVVAYEPQNSVQPQEREKQTPKTYSLKTDNYTSNNEPKSAKEQFKAKLDSESFMFE